MRLWPKALPRPTRFRDLRHRAATPLLRAGVDAHRVQRILCHRDVRTTTAIYGRLDVEGLREAEASLPGAAPTPDNRTAMSARAVAGARSTGLLPDPVAPKGDGPGPEDFSRGFRPVPEWALLVSNPQRKALVRARRCSPTGLAAPRSARARAPSLLPSPAPRPKPSTPATSGWARSCSRMLSGGSAGAFRCGSRMEEAENERISPPVGLGEPPRSGWRAPGGQRKGAAPRHRSTGYPDHCFRQRVASGAKADEDLPAWPWRVRRRGREFSCPRRAATGRKDPSSSGSVARRGTSSERERHRAGCQPDSRRPSRRSRRSRYSGGTGSVRCCW